MKKSALSVRGTAPSRGRFANTGNGPELVPIDIGHADYVALIGPDTAFWALVQKAKLAQTLAGGSLLAKYKREAQQMADEMTQLRFGLKPSAVYFNATERCNLNCRYCYIPENLRRSGQHMSPERVMEALTRLERYFSPIMKKGRKPQIIFHGAEPLLNKEAIYPAITKYAGKFLFGIQTNATQLDAEDVSFLREKGVALGLSLDADVARIADRTRVSWSGQGVYDRVLKALRMLRGYPNYSVICTITRENMARLKQTVRFFHSEQVPVCLLNVVRCTLPGARTVKPADADAARYFIGALEETHRLYQKTGRKLVVANFANILLSILAPTARRLMCDISPCGGGRCFVALAPNGDLFPCSEFIGLPKFKGGNLFKDKMEDVLQSAAFRKVTERKVEDIEPCRHCAIRHFCGSPCPAEAHEMNGGMEKTGAFCEFYEEQARYAFRLIADNRHEAFLLDGWDKGTHETFAL
ncbi:MAG TPA: peptide-modifying radical SAM enzyme CbpB [Planctomycetota bacterium]|jgi:uncharacterized protein